MFVTVFINSDDFIELVTADIVTLSDSKKVGEKLLDLITELEDRGKEIKILVDSRNVKGWGDATWTFLSLIFKDVHYERLATFGANPELYKEHTNFQKKNRLEDKIRDFKTREEAVSWLKS